MHFTAYAGITKELPWYTYRILVTTGEPPERVNDEEEIIPLELEIQAETLTEDELEKAHKLVFAHKGQEYNPVLAEMYLIPHSQDTKSC